MHNVTDDRRRTTDKQINTTANSISKNKYRANRQHIIGVNFTVSSNIPNKLLEMITRNAR